MKTTPKIAALAACLLAAAMHDTPAADMPHPNVLWISSEDHGTEMGCYGDKFATTPNVDKLAAKGMLYLHAWSNAPVCAASRTTIISGMYPPSTGGEHMRSMVEFPSGKLMFPQYLRQAGYYCTNNAKEDYNLTKPGRVWDESSKKAHWHNRPAGQPFFAVFNCEKSHESKLRTRPHKAIHDPAKVRVPAYHPDTPEVRQDWAQYYDTVTQSDAAAGERLAELADAGLTEDTIVFYFGDHGSGMPRSKRWPSNSGLHVPLVVYIPEKFADLRPPEYKAGAKSERPVAFVDFAPTMLSLAGLQPPAWMQGFAFLGKHIAPPQPFVYGFRGRMDERYDLVRSVTDGRHVYLRNYMPHLSQGQHVSYQFQTPTTALWHKLFTQGKLNEAQSIFWKTPKAPEELYDLQSDPDEVHNLADSPEYQAVLVRMRAAQQNLARRIRDIGFLPEAERLARAAGMAPYDFGHDESKYPFDRVFAMAELASRLQADSLPALQKGLADDDSAVRYWAALGILMRGEPAVAAARVELHKAEQDDSPDVRIVAAQALAQFGSEQDLKQALPLLVDLADSKQHGMVVPIAALNALGALGDKAASVADQIAKLPPAGKSPDARYNSYVPRLIDDLNSNLGPPPAKKADRPKNGKQKGT
jgi:uncharacterized sulfatase